MPRLDPASIGLTILLGAITALTPLAMDIYLVSMPLMTAAFDADAGLVQMTLGVYLLGNAIGQLWFGSISDRIGRRPMMLAGLAIFCLASIACALAPSIGMLLLARFFQGIGICTGQVVGRAIVRDCYSRDRAAQVMALMGLLTGIAPILAPIIGSYLHVWAGWQASFVFVAAYGVIAFAVVLLAMGETLKDPDPDAIRPARMVANFRTMLGNRGFVGYVITNCAMAGGLLAFLSNGPFVFIRVFGYSEQAFGVLFGTVMASNLCGAFIGSRLVRHVGIDRLIAVGSAGALLSGLTMCGLAFAGVDHIGAVLAPAMVFIFSFALVMPQALAGAMAPFPQMAGAASSLVGFLSLSFSALVGAVVGMAFNGTQLPLAIGLTAMGGLAFLGYRCLIARERNARAAA